MPLKIVCSECGHILYEGSYLKTPSEIMGKNEDVCPKCGKQLNPSTGSIHISPAEED
jgi:hypothetical protein